MILSAVATILVLAVAFYQVVQGLFSSLIMTILSILCALLAFSCYESLAASFLYENQPASADAIMLIATFVLPLLVLRVAVDKLIPGNVVFGPWTDRIGGGVLGLVTGLVMIGTLVLAMQMLPLGDSVFGYKPYDASLRRADRLGPLYPDEFTLGLVKMLSIGSMNYERDFVMAHDDLTLEMFCARNQVGRQMRVDARPDALQVEGVYEILPSPGQTLAQMWRTQEGKGALSQIVPGQRVFVARVRVHEDAREKSNWWLLPATHFRLVTGTGKSHYPVAYLWRDAKEKAWYTREADLAGGGAKIAELILGRRWENKPQYLTVDWVYVVDNKDAVGLEAKPKGDQPGAYMVFRRVARAEVLRVGQGKPGLPGMPPAQDALARRELDELEILRERALRVPQSLKVLGAWIVELKPGQQLRDVWLVGKKAPNVEGTLSRKEYQARTALVIRTQLNDAALESMGKPDAWQIRGSDWSINLTRTSQAHGLAYLMHDPAADQWMAEDAAIVSGNPSPSTLVLRREYDPDTRPILTTDWVFLLDPKDALRFQRAPEAGETVPVLDYRLAAKVPIPIARPGMPNTKGALTPLAPTTAPAEKKTP